MSEIITLQSYLIPFVGIIFGLFLVVKGADFFLNGAECLAKKFNIPQIIIGLTIVAIGTSAPEASVSINSAINRINGIAIGNVLGSNIANVLLILGVTSAICGLHFKKNTVKFEMPFLIFITSVLCLMGYYFSEITRICALILLLFFGCFLFYLYKISKKDEQEESKNCPSKISKILLFLIGGLTALIYGSDLTVDCACKIAELFNISERIIGLTIIAFGTCLPEFATCLVAAIKKQTDLAVGNIIGSLIFNLLFALGTACLIMPVAFEEKFLFDGIVALLSTLLLFIFTLKSKKLNKIQGIIMTVLYFAYIFYLFKH